jgi:hypothetical protein
VRRADNLTTFMCRFCRNSGIFNLLDPCCPAQGQLCTVIVPAVQPRIYSLKSNGVEGFFFLSSEPSWRALGPPSFMSNGCWVHCSKRLNCEVTILLHPLLRSGMSRATPPSPNMPLQLAWVKFASYPVIF